MVAQSNIEVEFWAIRQHVWSFGVQRYIEWVMYIIFGTYQAILRQQTYIRNYTKFNSTKSYQTF